MEPPHRLISTIIEQFNKGLLHKALSEISKSLINYPSSAILYNMEGATYSRLGRQDDALRSFEKAISINPKSAEAKNNIGNILKDRGDTEKAIKTYKQALLLKPDYTEAFFNLGNTFKEIRNWNDAIKAYNKAISLKPDYAEAFYNRGLVQSNMGDLDSAIESYNRAISIYPNFGAAFNNRGNALLDKGEIEKATKNYEQAVRLSPNDADAWNNLGVVLGIIGNHRNAIASFNQALKVKPGYLDALFNLGKILKSIGELKKAEKYFETVIKLDKDDAMGAVLQLANIGNKSVPKKTPKLFMKNFYKKRAKIWDSQPLEEYSGHLLIASAFGQANVKRDNVILDLGCGTGSLASFLRPYAKTLIGIDLSSEMLAYAERSKQYDILFEADIEDYLSEKFEYYDIVVAAAVFIHFLNLENIFSLILNSLKKDGKFIFTVFESQKQDKYLNDFLMYSHSDEYISSLASRFNFRIVYRERAIHEYQEEKPIYALSYFLEKISEK